MLRPDLRLPRYPQLTQGSVFCCAAAERYSRSEVYGLVITARCDVAQNKYPVLNYLPVVRLRDWLREDGLDILIETEAANELGTLKGALKQAHLSLTLLDTIPLKEIAEKNFPLHSGNKTRDKTSENFRKIAQDALNFRALTQTGDRETIFSWFASSREPSIGELINRLSRHAVTGYYLFESLDFDRADNTPYVCCNCSPWGTERIAGVA